MVTALQSEPGPAPRRKTPARYCVLLVDPRPLTRESIARFLASQSREFDVRSVAHVGEISAIVASMPRLDLCLLNVGARGIDDAETQREIDALRSAFGDTPIVLLAESAAIRDVRNALAAGMRGYMPTSLSGSVIVAALRLVLAGGTFVPAMQPQPESAQAGGWNFDSRRDAAGDPNGGDLSKVLDLTPRETEVLRLLWMGKANKIIAYELKMSESTVKGHVHHIMRKLHATNRTQVAYLANKYFSGNSLKADGPS